MKTHLTVLSAFVALLCNVSATSMSLRLDIALQSEKQTMVAILKEIHRLYGDDRNFLATLDEAQSSWEAYLAQTIRARYPNGPPAENFAEARLALPVVEARVKELRIWLEGVEQDSPLRGTVMLKAELEELRKKKSGEQGGTDPPATAPGLKPDGKEKPEPEPEARPQ